MPELTPPMSREQLFDLILIIRWSEGAAGPRALEAQDRILAEFDRLTAAVSAARAEERERCLCHVEAAKLQVVADLRAAFGSTVSEAGHDFVTYGLNRAKALIEADTAPPAPEGEQR